MARAYASASSQYFEYNGAITAEPFTFSCWAYVAATGVSAQALMSFGTSVTTAGRYILFAGGTSFTPNNSVAAQAVNAAGSGANAIAASTYSAATWFQAGIVFASSASRTAYFNGAGGTEETTSITIDPNMDRAMLGTRMITGTRGLFLNGRLAEAGMWNVALTASEMASLGAGVSPLLIRPQSLVGYWPSFARATNEEPWAGANVFVPGASSPTAIDHPPRIIYPSRPRIIIPAAAVGGTFVPIIGRGPGMALAAGRGLAA